MKLLAYLALIGQRGASLNGIIDCVAATRQNFSSSKSMTHMGLLTGPMQAAHFLPGEIRIGGRAIWEFATSPRTRANIEFLFTEVEHLPVALCSSRTTNGIEAHWRVSIEELLEGFPSLSVFPDRARDRICLRATQAGCVKVLLDEILTTPCVRFWGNTMWSPLPTWDGPDSHRCVRYPIDNALPGSFQIVDGGTFRLRKEFGTGTLYGPHD
jgi:hypothetical protein